MSDVFDIVDFHTHILPGADHGSSSLKTSAFQLKEAEHYGVSRIIATPHFYPTVHSVDSFIERRRTAYEKLSELSKSAQIRLGAEVLLCNGIEDLPSLDKIFIEGTRTLLLELPFADFQSAYCDSVYNLVGEGVEVILAHADRYPAENIEKLVECGARLQLNSDSLDTLFRRNKLYEWLDRGLVVGLGSDIHGEDKKAYKHFAAAKNKINDYLVAIKKESDRIFSSVKNKGAVSV